MAFGLFLTSQPGMSKSLVEQIPVSLRANPVRTGGTHTCFPVDICPNRHMSAPAGEPDVELPEQERSLHPGPQRVEECADERRDDQEDDDRPRAAQAGGAGI